MGPFQAMILGIVQGLTEFLPVSSDGHLVIVQQIMGLKEPELLFDVCVHAGTLAAVFVYFYKDIINICAACIRGIDSLVKGERKLPALIQKDADIRMAILIIIGTIPTAIIGLGFNKIADLLFSNLIVTGVCLLVTAGLLLGTRWAGRAVFQGPDMLFRHAALIGVMQGFAVLPGLSRSASTIATALYLGISREAAFRYSFLLSIPGVLGAVILSILSESSGGMLPLNILIIGAGTAAVTGYVALSMLVRIVQSGKLYYFAPYCIIIGIIAIMMGR